MTNIIPIYMLNGAIITDYIDCPFLRIHVD